MMFLATNSGGERLRRAVCGSQALCGALRAVGSHCAAPHVAGCVYHISLRSTLGALGSAAPQATPQKLILANPVAGKSALTKKTLPNDNMAHTTASQKSELLKEVDKLIGVPHQLEKQEQYEIEARIGTFRGKKFESSVNSKDFYRVLEHFLTHTDNIYVYVPQETSVRTEQIIGGPVFHMPDIVTEATFVTPQQRIRESFIDIPNVATPRFYSTKRMLDNVDFVDYFTRFSIAREQYLAAAEKSPVPAGMEPQSLRIKHRWSFELADQQADHPLQPYRVDMTHVTGWYVNAQNQQIPINSHEIELEVIYKPIKSAQKELWPGVHFMLELVQNTPFPVTAGTMSNVIQSFNDLFSDDISNLEWAMKKKNPRWSFNTGWRLFNVVNKPINLQLSALTMPELLAITDKADGERRLLYMRTDGAYLLYPPTDVLRYLRTPLPGQEIKEGDLYYIQPERAATLKDTVIDGELVLRSDGTRDYLAFDLLVDRGTDYRQVKFTNRIKRLQELLAENPIPGITMKEYYQPPIGNFYERANQVLDSIPHKPYGNDGLIFNTVTDPYAGKVYKWKPPRQLTIDFHIRQVDPVAFEVYAKNDDRRGPKLIQFVGTPRYPMSGVMVADPPVVNNIPLSTGQIVEMAWDSAANAFVPVRIRHDRDEPNNLSTAINVWRDIMDPIPEVTIRGHDLKTMRQYHNVIKKNMLERCKKGIIVDIGSGRGGDLHKWKHLGVEVLAVEPSADNLDEFRKRLLEADYKQTSADIFTVGDTSVTLLQGFGQDTDKIVQAYKKGYGKNRATQSVHCMTIFNALTFFFDKESSLDALVKTIDQLLQVGGHLIGMVMDGEQVRQMLVKHSLLKQTIRKLKPDQYFNLDTKSTINERTIKKFFKNDKWRLVSKDKKLLRQTVKALEEPDPTEVKEPGWTITRTKPFTDSPFGNEIKIDLPGDTIVHDQIEYLTDFDELTRKLAEKNIILKDTYLLSMDAALSPSQQEFNKLFRSFTFERQHPVVTPEEKEIVALPLTGVARKKLQEAQDNKKLTKTLLEKARSDLATAEKKLGEIETKIKELRAAGKKISPKEGQQMANDRRQFELDADSAKKRIEKHEKDAKKYEQDIKTAEKELAKLEPVIVTAPGAPAKKVKPVAPKKPPLAPVIALPKPEPPVKEPPKPVVKEPAKKPPVFVEESKKIITSYKFDPADAYVAIEQPPTALLKLEEKAPVNIKNIDFMRIGTIKPTCVIAALLRAAFPAYIMNQNEAKAPKLTPSQKTKREHNVNKVQSTFLDTYFKNAYNKGELETLSQYYDTWDAAKKVLKKCQNWQWLGLWQKIASSFKVNIVVVTADSPYTAPHIYRTGKEQEKTVLVYNHEGVFDTLGQPEASGNLVTAFGKDDITINSL